MNQEKKRILTQKNARYHSLSDIQREEIKKRYISGESIAHLAKAYNVVYATILWHVRGLKKPKSFNLLVDPESKPITRLFLYGPPTSTDKLPYGSHGIDFGNKTIYVQMNHDQENPQWVLQEQKHGILKRILGWLW